MLCFFLAGKGECMKQTGEKVLSQQRSEYREQIRRLFMQNGLSALQSLEALEYLLFFIGLRKDVKTVAKNLLEKFNTISCVLDASADELKEFGLTSRMTTDISFLRELLTYYNLEKVKNRPFLSTSDETIRYLQSKIGSCKKEKLMVLFLDDRKHLKGFREFTGTVNKVPVSPREIAEAALLFRASSVILAHNHPSGDCQPSDADIDFTRTIYNALNSLEIRLEDHLIITRTNFFSLMT